MWNNLLLYIFLCEIIISFCYEIVYFFYITFVLHMYYIYFHEFYSYIYYLRINTFLLLLSVTLYVCIGKSTTFLIYHLLFHKTTSVFIRRLFYHNEIFFYTLFKLHKILDIPVLASAKVRPRPDGTKCDCRNYHSSCRNRTRPQPQHHCNCLRGGRKECSC